MVNLHDVHKIGTDLHGMLITVFLGFKQIFKFLDSIPEQNSIICLALPKSVL